MIDLSGGKGHKLICYTVNGGTNQKWKWDGKHIISLVNNHVMDVSGGSTKLGAEIILYAPNNQMNQEWELVDVNAV